jgi:hypothetical protein
MNKKTTDTNSENNGELSINEKDKLIQNIEKIINVDEDENMLANELEEDLVEDLENLSLNEKYD